MLTFFYFIGLRWEIKLQYSIGFAVGLLKQDRILMRFLLRLTITIKQCIRNSKQLETHRSRSINETRSRSRIKVKFRISWFRRRFVGSSWFTFVREARGMWRKNRFPRFLRVHHKYSYIITKIYENRVLSLSSSVEEYLISERNKPKRLTALSICPPLWMNLILWITENNS